MKSTQTSRFCQEVSKRFGGEPETRTRTGFTLRRCSKPLLYHSVNSPLAEHRGFEPRTVLIPLPLSRRLPYQTRPMFQTGYNPHAVSGADKILSYSPTGRIPREPRRVFCFRFVSRIVGPDVHSNRTSGPTE